ncbi:xylulokinase [Actinocatenispora rupis]|uniref:Xylulose kinase n=1 Tax=Actinocatenispora rupis TaxID=519421 RepID=A0A8J3NDD9_9ACTN|nr:xylulokinase [Actinocatenispora rupis]GID14961.1 xylulokinase [Actinocatenispora rupis]
MAVRGIDSSTQSCKVLTVDETTGRVLATGQAPHPDGTEVDPLAWWRALADAGGHDTDGVDALSVAAQQHGMVALDGDDTPVRPALLWNDVRSAPQAARLTTDLGAEWWAKSVGLVPVASYTVTKLAWLAEHEPVHAARVARVLLPHDWLTWRLLGATDPPTTDRSDASGTGYWSPVTGRYERDLLVRALGHDVDVPEVRGPTDPAGRTADGTLVAAGAGDNAAAALGLDLRPGEAVVSLGTSGAVFTVTDRPVTDPTGAVASFADATGRFLPLACTLNAARVLSATATLLDTDLSGLDALAESAPPDAGGLVLLPYLDGERTPNLPDAAGSLHGLRRATMTPPHLARAAVLGMLCGLADCLDELRRHGASIDRVLLIGGAARSRAVRSAAPDVFGVPVLVPEPAEYVALGAARQAAWLLSGADEPPAWPRQIADHRAPTGAPWTADLRARYAEHRRRTYGV